MQLVVGQSALSGDFESYVQRLSALEVSIGPDAPKSSRLERWRQQAPAEFVFSVELSQLALHERTPTAADVEQAIAAASILKAQWVIVRTPPQVRPDSRVKQRLATLTQLLASESYTVGWEPSGLWEARAAMSVASDLGIVVVNDLTREDPPTGPLLYTRLRHKSRSPGPDQLLRLIERVLPAQQCVVIVEGSGADQVQRGLHEQLQFLGDPDAASA
ncbi:MAG TPA: DUF72 domain-containing protein [Polyangiaceae bacterium]|nr:DUF72 domain-containing protein [Polyangiaceae bacterium]